MKKQVEIIILLLFGLAFLVYLFPYVFVEAAKLESGVTIKAPSTTETEEICDDAIDNDKDGKIDATDEDCAAAPAGPAAGTCGLQIVSGVPINYGQVYPGQIAFPLITNFVEIKNVGDFTGKIMAKGGDWISNTAGSPTVFGPEITSVAITGRQYTALTSNELFLGWLDWHAIERLNFKLKVPPSAVSGSYHQEVTIDLLC